MNHQAAGRRGRGARLAARVERPLAEVDKVGAVGGPLVVLPEHEHLVLAVPRNAIDHVLHATQTLLQHHLALACAARALVRIASLPASLSTALAAQPLGSHEHLKM